MTDFEPEVETVDQENSPRVLDNAIQVEIFTEVNFAIETA